MTRFKVVSVDMFGTLANGDSIAPLVWRPFLKDRYTDELAKQCWDRAGRLVFQHYDEVVRDRRYVPPKAIYQQCYSELFPEIGVEFDTAEAAMILARGHASSQPFPDALPFLESVGKRYPICLSSDTDEDMLGPLRQMYPFDAVFTSEALGTYKTGPEGKFFKAVIEHYKVEPGRVIHIGDSLSDIMGAHEAGIVACWLNRSGKTWSYEIKPDYEVKSLAEATALLLA